MHVVEYLFLDWFQSAFKHKTQPKYIHKMEHTHTNKKKKCIRKRKCKRFHKWGLTCFYICYWKSLSRMHSTLVEIQTKWNKYFVSIFCYLYNNKKSNQKLCDCEQNIVSASICIMRFFSFIQFPTCTMWIWFLCASQSDIHHVYFNFKLTILILILNINIHSALLDLQFYFLCKYCANNSAYWSWMEGASFVNYFSFLLICI